jgi:hypothetical protein
MKYSPDVTRAMLGTNVPSILDRSYAHGMRVYPGTIVRVTLPSTGLSIGGPSDRKDHGADA